jgi:splicing factor 3A subunit 3
LEELVKSDGLEHITLDDGEEEVIDRECQVDRRWTILIEYSSALDTMFTGEESMGRYLDLYIPHTQFVNLKSARRYARYFAILSAVQTLKFIGAD